MKSYEDLIQEISSTGIPQKPFFTVMQLKDGHVFTIEADSTEELYSLVVAMEDEAKREGLLD
ncbi:MAG: hypothetical protein GX308_08455 [Epulopiscium sp.]|nr:hypothetical protein [Candidatus Epulonipiscium sp.]